jgi:inosose dehydratase
LPVGALGAGIQVGYAAITWGGNDLQAIKDISEVGFRGIQLRSPILRDFGDKPQALRDLLKQYRLEFVALSGGGPGPNSGTDQDVITTQVKHAEFMRATGGRYLQMTDSSRPKDRKPVADELKKLGQLLTEVGKRTSDLGIPVAYHNHMNSMGEAPDEVDAIMDAADPRYVKLLLDVAHYQQGGGDPVKAITQYRDRILFLHIKDVESPVPGATGDLSRSYRFVELGRGKVNLPDVFAALKKIKFSGWAIVELDRVPDPAVTPKEAAIVCKKYLEEKLKMKI